MRPTAMSSSRAPGRGKLGWRAAVAVAVLTATPGPQARAQETDAAFTQLTEDNPELGLTGQPSPGAQQSALDDPPTLASSDHATVVGTFGVGFFGIERLPLMLPDFDPSLCVRAPCEGPTIAAPTVGVRYWLSERVGLQVGLGFHLSSGTISTESGEQDTLSTFGIGLHVAAPLAIASSGHFVFQVVPFLNAGLTRGSVVDPQTADNDLDLSGRLLEVGGSVGTEIHFGFIDLPSLALQANVGLSMRFEGRSVTAGGAETTYATTRVVTSVGEAPWELLTGALSAIYYFR